MAVPARNRTSHLKEVDIRLKNVSTSNSDPGTTGMPRRGWLQWRPSRPIHGSAHVLEVVHQPSAFTPCWMGVICDLGGKVTKTLCSRASSLGKTTDLR